MSYYASPPGKPAGAADYEDYRAWAALPRAERDANPFGVESVARAKLAKNDEGLENVEVIVEGGNRRIVIGPDNTLFVTTSTWAGAEGEVLPQQLDSYIGKILRVNRDGSIPSNNPWVEQNDFHPEIYAFGFRDIERVFPAILCVFRVFLYPRFKNKCARNGVNHDLVCLYCHNDQSNLFEIFYWCKY